MSVIVAVDVGGTQIRVAAYPENGIEPIAIRKIPTRTEDQDVFSRLTCLIQSLWDLGPVGAISVAVPGPLDPRTGRIVTAGNIPDWNDFPLYERLTQEFQVPVFFGNDANFAALGEWYYGAGRGHHHILYLTISTGIGGGVIINDELLEGACGLAAELGHVVVIPDGPLCSCGVKGHLEAVSSGTGIAQYITDEIARGRYSSMNSLHDITSRDAFFAAKEGDQLALEAFQRAGKYLGQALAGFLHIFNPSIVILGGGVSQGSEFFLSTMHIALSDQLMTPAYMDGVQIVRAQLGDDAGLLGALAKVRIKKS